MPVPNGNASGPSRPLYTAPTWQAGDALPKFRAGLSNVGSAVVAAKNARRQGLKNDARRAAQKEANAGAPAQDVPTTEPTPVVKAFPAAPVRTALPMGKPKKAIKPGAAPKNSVLSKQQQQSQQSQQSQQLPPRYEQLYRKRDLPITAAPQKAITARPSSAKPASAYTGRRSSSPRLSPGKSNYTGAPSPKTTAPYSRPSSMAAIKDSTKVTPL
jgi:hypothetical protein